jgi:hypothetical protein
MLTKHWVAILVVLVVVFMGWKHWGKIKAAASGGGQQAAM